MILAKLKFIKNLIGYALLVLALIVSPIGWVLLIMLLFINRNQYCLNTWLIIDKLGCHLCHNTGLHRTISGYTG